MFSILSILLSSVTEKSSSMETPKRTEISGKKLGVIGLGAIGVLVANAATNLGMEVYGYDPYISVNAAWSLSLAQVPATFSASVPGAGVW